MLNNCCGLFLANTPQGEGCSHCVSSKSSHVKRSLPVTVARELQTVEIKKILQNETFGKPKSGLLFPVPVEWLLVFSATKLDFLNQGNDTMRRNDNGDHKYHKFHCCYQHSATFLRINSLDIIVKLFG